MVRESEVREGELTVDVPPAGDAALYFIGRIRTPWTSRLETPRQGRHDGPVCRLEIFEPWVPALKGVDFYSNLEVIYWLHHSRRDLVLQSPKNNQTTRGAFSLRSPVRPNPIGTSIVKLVGIEGNVIWCAASIASTRRRCSTSSPIAASSRRCRRRRPGISRRSEASLGCPGRSCVRIQPLQRRDQLGRVVFQHLDVFLAAGRRQQRDAVMARHHVHMQVEHDLSAGGFVELLRW